jgi:photosystem II stability/assembly factor-like uncharacterized protein
MAFVATALAQTRAVPAKESRWEPMGPFGGSAAVVAVDPNHAGTVLAASNNALLFRTRNEGANWEPIQFPGQLRSTLHAFAIDGMHGSAYYAGVSSDTLEQAGLYRSTDEGATWEQLPGLKKKDVWSLAFSPSDPNTMAVGARDGVHLSTDAGKTWRKISPPENRELAPVVSLAFDPKNAAILYAGTPHLPWKTPDGGATWQPVREGMLDDSDVFSIHIDASRPERVFASACSGIYRSESAASLWKKMTQAQGSSYRTYFVTVDPKQPNLVFAGTTFGVSKSADGGETWHRISKEATRWIAFDEKNPGRMYFATDEAGMLRSDDSGETIRAVNNGFCNRQLPAITSTGKAVLTASIYEPVEGGVFQLRSGEANWERIAPASEVSAQLLRMVAVPAVDDHQAQSVFALSYDSMLVSADGGRKWSTAPPLGAKLKATAFAGASAGTSPLLFAGTEAGLYRRESGEKSWTRVDAPFGKQKITVLAYLASSGLAVATQSGIFVSADGAAWKTTAPMPGERLVNNIVSAGDRRLIAGTTAGLIRSDDFGASWEPVRWGLGSSSVSAVCQHPSAPRTVFAAQFGVVFQSSDAGETWTRVSPDRIPGSFQLETIKGLAVLPGAPDRLLALTQNQGTFALPLPTSSGGAVQSTSNTGRIGKSTTAR